jgi:hypothetical protein
VDAQCVGRFLRRKDNLLGTTLPVEDAEVQNSIRVTSWMYRRPLTQFRSLIVPATLSDNIASNVGITDQRLAGEDLDVSIRHLTETVCQHMREETDKNHDKPVRIVEGPPKFKSGTSLKQVYSNTANRYSWSLAVTQCTFYIHRGTQIVHKVTIRFELLAPERWHEANSITTTHKY